MSGALPPCPRCGQAAHVTVRDAVRCELYTWGKPPLMLSRPRSLTQALAEHGWTHRPSARVGTTGAHDVVDGDGVLIFRGRVDETWSWLGRVERGVQRA